MNLSQIIKTHNPAQDFLELERAFRKVIPLKPKVIMEIGIYKCGLLKTLWDVFSPRVLIGIDKEKIDCNINATILSPMDSNHSETHKAVLKVLKGKKIDFLVIDGDHRYNNVKRDFELYKSLLKSGSCIMFHDIAVSNVDPSFCEVQRYWNDIKHKYNYQEIKHSVGTGLIFL